MSLTTCGSRKPIATVIRKMSIHVITPPVVHHDDATPHFWDFPDRAHLWPLDWPWHRTIHGRTPVHAPVIVVLNVLGQESHEMSFV